MRSELSQRIRKKYLPPEEDKMEQLRRLDRSSTRKGTIVSIIVGAAGCLLLGVGMCCTMVWMESLFIPGVVIGVVGIAVVAAAAAHTNHFYGLRSFIEQVVNFKRHVRFLLGFSTNGIYRSVKPMALHFF